MGQSASTSTREAIDALWVTFGSGDLDKLITHYAENAVATFTRDGAMQQFHGRDGVKSMLTNNQLVLLSEEKDGVKTAIKQQKVVAVEPSKTAVVHLSIDSPVSGICEIQDIFVFDDNFKVKHIIVYIATVPKMLGFSGANTDVSA
uniref:SnoaL-like domain-containing protein n=2 Tax=Calcidiscus leptoporus TaxID=127549 RepID=A0A7S0NTE0_9EUKA|mmetsp:Transcript_23/g.59  ORF Transcript_23/g.59 Transcript_23/m.59 type:complete len:146 (+) Transcript_23:112-549(+)